MCEHTITCSQLVLVHLCISTELLNKSTAMRLVIRYVAILAYEFVDGKLIKF